MPGSLQQKTTSKTLGEELARVEGQLSLFVKLPIAFSVPALVGIIGILLKMLWCGS